MRKIGFFTRLLSVVLMLAMVVPLMPLSAMAEGETAVKQYGYIVINNNSQKREANFRRNPNTDDNNNYPIARLPEGWAVEILGETTKNGVRWYRVSANTADNLAVYQEGYMMAQFVQLMTAEEQSSWLLNQTQPFKPAVGDTTGGTGTGTTEQKPDNPPAGDVVVQPGTGTELGYIRLVKDSVNIRLTPAGKVLNENNQLPLGLVLPYYGMVANVNKYNWVQVIYDGMTGYIRSDCYGFSDANGNLLDQGQPVTPADPANPAAFRYIRIQDSENAAFLFSQADMNSMVLNNGLTVPTGTVLKVELFMESNSYDWAKVTYNNQTGYVCVKNYFECDEKGKPLSGQEAQCPAGFVKITGTNVGLRPTPGGTFVMTDVIPKDTVVTWENGATVTEGGNVWIHVYHRGSSGYINTTEFIPVELFNDASLSGVGIGYIKLTADKVALRQTPGGTVLNDKDRMPLGKILAYSAGPVYSGKYEWVQVAYNGNIGYVRSDCYVFTDENGTPIVTPTPAASTTPIPGAVTDAPIIPEGSYGRVNTDNVFFRKEMSMSPNADFWARLPRNWMMEVLGSEMKNGILWYKVQGGTPANPTRTYTGYIHGDYLTLVSANTETPNPTYTRRYAQILINGINVRQTPGGTAITALLYGTVVNVIQAAASNTAYDWYYIEYMGTWGYVEGSALRMLAESEEPYVNLPPAPAPTATPSPTPAYTGTGYVRLVLDKVNIRKTPGGTVLTPTEGSKLPVGLVLRYTEGPVKNGNYEWVKITYAGKTGYIRSDCYTQCDQNGLVPLPSATPTPAPGEVGQTYIRLIKSGVNVRTTPWGTSQGQLPKGSILPYFGTQMNGSETWFEVYSSTLGCYGYILGTMAVTCDVNGNLVVPTLAPTTTPTGGAYTSYVATSVSSVWLRTSPAADAATDGQVARKGTVLPLIGMPIVNGVYTWYPVQLSDGTRGYLRGDCVYQLADWQLDYYNKYGTCPTPTPGAPTPRPGNSEYIKTTADKLWVRETPSTKAGTLGQLALGTVTKFYKKQIVGNVIWYQISYNGKLGWVHGDYVRVMTNAEYDEWHYTNVPSTVPTAMPDPSTFSDMALTTADRVRIRATASMSGAERIMVYEQGSKLTYLGNYTTPTAQNPYYWFNVKYGGVSGWMCGDYVRVLTVEEKRLYTLTGDPDAPKEATYRTLSKGSSGEDVTKLQQKLVEKGYLAASEVTGTYLTSTENAVIAFQRANRLTVDGIAGEKTQHALFGTVPEGSYDGSTVTPVLYPVEKIDWFRGGIQSIWRVGTVAVITDVYTGISFRAQRLYGDNHADCEPKTTADTAAICQIYGVSNAQEISDREPELQSWRRRPLWVTIGGRTFCASMYGIPHNFEGDRIPDNNYNGQFCVHFTNSMTHGSGNLPPQVDKDAGYNGYFGHQSAIEYAYKNSQSGKK